MQSPKKYTNKLIDETSPYLLQHAHNPVQWYPWGDEAFEKARSEDKPLLVSIGYSACHWCHVMEHESFEDSGVARVMNEHFVNIKVDMEERPDVDQIYMNFVQITTGRGGWPMNVFITPDKLPFFGGTYFPPTQRHGMPSWEQILMSIAEAWRERRSELIHSANEILGELRRISTTESSFGSVDTSLLDAAFDSFVRTFDSKNGGWGGAPKFPQAMSMEFLLRYWKRAGNENALEMVKMTAEKMANGGMYDQLGGGFHRYAVDAIWLVPHFEKMLYDNAQLIRVYLHLYQIFRSIPSVVAGDDTMRKPAREQGRDTQLPDNAFPDDQASVSLPAAAGGTDNYGEFFKRIAVQTLEYVKCEMTDAGGGFYSSQDADSEGVEGKFFVWEPEEIAKILGEEDAQVFNFFYDVSEEGNFEEKNILNVNYSDEAAARALKIDESELSDILERGRAKLFAEREKRIKPFRDEKVLTAWNGLMLAAFAEAAAVLDSEDYLAVAKKNADFLLENLQKPDRQGGHSPDVGLALPDSQASASTWRLLRTWKDGRAKLNGYIEDYANLADGLIELYQVSGEEKYLSEAKRLADAMITEFWDEENGGFYFTSNDHEELIVRNKDFYDNATPSGNSVAADVLLKLAKFFGGAADSSVNAALPDGQASAVIYEQFALMALRIASQQINRHPQGFGRALSAIEFHVGEVKEIVIVGEDRAELEKVVWAKYRSNKVVAVASDASGSELPLLKDRTAIDGKATAYVCENFVCARPVMTGDELLELLDAEARS